MQDYKTLLLNLKKILSVRVGDEHSVTVKLVAITGKDYKSVWRRLRGEYRFTFDEIFNICTELGISMECLGDKNAASVSSLQVYQFPEPFSLSKNYISTLFSILEKGAECPDSAYTVVCNRVPEALHIRYDKLSQLLLLKMGYFTRESIPRDFFRKLIEGWPDFEVLKNRYLDLIDTFSSLTFLWGTNIIENVIKDISFFLDVDMIDRRDALQIKDELREMIAYLDAKCADPSPHHAFTLAVSPVDMNFHSNTMNSAKVNRTDFFLYHHAFCGTENQQDMRSQKIITDRLMNCAVILSGSNHSERNRFMKSQLDLIERI